MREILFRGKRIDNGEWVYGFLYETEKSSSYNAESYILEKERLTINYKCVEGITTHIPFVQVTPNTVGQYTGLTDKNGKKIFEGDILSIAQNSDGMGQYYYPPIPYPAHVVVKWDLCSWMWEVIGKDKYYLSFPDAWCHYDCEVIGNIHDNPELLDNSELLEDKP